MFVNIFKDFLWGIFYLIIVVIIASSPSENTSEIEIVVLCFLIGYSTSVILRKIEELKNNSIQQDDNN